MSITDYNTELRLETIKYNTGLDFEFEGTLTKLIKSFNFKIELGGKLVGKFKGLEVTESNDSVPTNYFIGGKTAFAAIIDDYSLWNKDNE